MFNTFGFIFQDISFLLLLFFFSVCTFNIFILQLTVKLVMLTGVIFNVFLKMS